MFIKFYENEITLNYSKVETLYSNHSIIIFRWNRTYDILYKLPTNSGTIDNDGYIFQVYADMINNKRTDGSIKTSRPFKTRINYWNGWGYKNLRLIKMLGKITKMYNYYFSINNIR